MIDCCHRTSVAKVQPEINYYLNGTLKEVTSGVLARGPRALSERKLSWRTNSRSTTGTGTVAYIHRSEIFGSAVSNFSKKFRQSFQV